MMPPDAAPLPVSPTLDKSGRNRDQPRKRIDLVQAYRLRVENRLTFAEIATMLGVPKSTVHAALHRLNKLVPDPETLKAFEEVEPQLLTAAKERLLASLLDPKKLEKASANNLAYCFQQVFQAHRLCTGGSTQNVNVLGKMISEVQRTFYENKPRIEK